jgi:hypothetical protein
MDWLRFDASDGRVRKLSATDTGTGMTADQLRQYINQLASSGREQSASGNFGVGAKVAAGSRNPHGLEYRSWHEGQGSLVCFKRHPDGRWRLEPQRWENGRTDYWRPLAEADKPWLLRGQDHGTQVVLLGQHERDDTTQAPASVTEARRSHGEPPPNGPIDDAHEKEHSHPIVSLPDVAWITARDGSRGVGDLEDQAARYHPGRHELTVNADFRAISDLITHWRRRYQGVPGAYAVIDARVREWCEQVLVELVLAARSSTWSAEQLDALLSPTSFTAALLPRHLLHVNLQKRLGQKLGAPRRDSGRGRADTSDIVRGHAPSQSLPLGVERDRPLRRDDP